uniref:Uncharacterized protein n=1 Tax=Rhodnius prolixus TaxID=13249 RepID=T1I1F5_RHOPR
MAGGKKILFKRGGDCRNECLPDSPILFVCYGGEEVDNNHNPSLNPDIGELVREKRCPKENTQSSGKKLKRSRSSPENIGEANRKLLKSGSDLEMATPTKSEIVNVSMEKLMATFSALLDSKNYVTREDFYGMEAKINELQDENKVLKKEIENLKMRDKLQEAQLDNIENKAKEKFNFRGVEHKTGDDYKLKIETFVLIN